MEKYELSRDLPICEGMIKYLIDNIFTECIDQILLDIDKILIGFEILKEIE